MTQVLFFTDNSMFPLVWNGKRYIPRNVIGGYIFSIEKQTMLNDLNINYTVVNLDTIEFPVVEEPQ